MFATSHQQRRTVSQPLVSDKQLLGFSSVIQDNLFELWLLSHDHIVAPLDKTNYAALTTDAERVDFIATFLGLK